MSSPVLDAAAEALASVVVSSLGDDDLDALIADVARLRAAVDGLWLSVLAAADARQLHRRHQARDTSTWLATVAGERVGAIRRDLELADTLASAPVVATAVTEHSLSTTRAAELARARDLPAPVIEALAAAATQQSVVELAREVRRARLDHDLREPAVEACCHVTRSHDRVRLDATLDLVDGELVELALDTYGETAKLPSDLPYAQRRAAALVGLARYFLGHVSEPAMTRVGRPHLLVSVDLAVLEARSGGTARLASGAVITGDAARQLALDANVSRIITAGASQILDVGRATRTVPAAIAKAVITRDRHCRYAGCTSPPWNCDIHHRRSWADGGPTALDNLGLLCWYHHHRVVHASGTKELHELADGSWTIDPPPCEEAA